jgi:hypothetical protein
MTGIMRGLPFSPTFGIGGFAVSLYRGFRMGPPGLEPGTKEL